jgi:hypothetical protein
MISRAGATGAHVEVDLLDACAKIFAARWIGTIGSVAEQRLEEFAPR